MPQGQGRIGIHEIAGSNQVLADELGALSREAAQLGPNLAGQAKQVSVLGNRRLVGSALKPRRKLAVTIPVTSRPTAFGAVTVIAPGTARLPRVAPALGSRTLAHLPAAATLAPTHLVGLTATAPAGAVTLTAVPAASTGRSPTSLVPVAVGTVAAAGLAVLTGAFVSAGAAGTLLTTAGVIPTTVRAVSATAFVAVAVGTLAIGTPSVRAVAAAGLAVLIGAFVSAGAAGTLLTTAVVPTFLTSLAATSAVLVGAAAGLVVSPTGGAIVLAIAPRTAAFRTFASPTVARTSASTVIAGTTGATTRTGPTALSSRTSLVTARTALASGILVAHGESFRSAKTL